MKTGSFKTPATGAALILACGLTAGAASATCAQTEQSTVNPEISDHRLNDQCAPEALNRLIAGNRSASEAPKETDALTAWIAAQTGWPERTPPIIRFVSREEIQKVFGRGMTSDLKVEALHSNKDHVVYLLETWRADDVRDRSILLHEIVHHLQYLNGIKVSCAAEEERQAFELQIKWLRDQGVEDPLALIGINRLFLYLLQCDEM